MDHIFSSLPVKNQRESGKPGTLLGTFLVVGILMSSPVICTSYAKASAGGDDHQSTNKFDEYKDDDHRSMNKHEALRVAILPNEIIFGGQIKSDTIRSINERHTDFNIFTGDTKNGATECTDAAIGQDVFDYFNELDSPTLYSVGDNEWTDCHRVSNGGFDPIERLSFIRQTFFSKPITQGPHPIKVNRQGSLGDKYSENSRFIKNDISFVALHVVGSNNNLVATAKQCTDKSKRGEADCAAATVEYLDRNEADIIWMQDSFKEAREKNLAGIVIAIQADVYFPFELSDGGYQDNFLPQLDENNGFSEFFKTLAEETKAFKGEVVLIHGDSHYLKIDKAMYQDDGTLTSNFTRIETFGDLETSWIEMIVDPRGKSLFSFNPVILKPLAE